MDYLGVLEQLHRLLKPDVYLEIGVQHGGSMVLSRSKTIGVDPAIMGTAVAVADKPWMKLYQTTSDTFFSEHDREAALEGGHLGLAFIDGLHLFEQVLRDLINVERWTSPDSVIVLHDVIPPDLPSTGRVPQPGNWVGDVWKVAPCLARYRPDLVTDIIAAGPSGMLVIRNPDATNTVLAQRYQELVDEFVVEGDDSNDAVAAYLVDLKPTDPTDFLRLIEADRRRVEFESPRASSSDLYLDLL